MIEAELAVAPVGAAYAVVCSTHGVVNHWTSPVLAAFAAMGHGSAHHRRTDGR